MHFCSDDVQKRYLSVRFNYRRVWIISSTGGAGQTEENTFVLIDELWCIFFILIELNIQAEFIQASNYPNNFKFIFLFFVINIIHLIFSSCIHHKHFRYNKKFSKRNLSGSRKRRVWREVIKRFATLIKNA